MKENYDKVRKASWVHNQSSPVYFFGLIGSLVYYLQVAHGFGAILLAFVKAIAWPAFITYDVLKFLAR